MNRGDNMKIGDIKEKDEYEKLVPRPEHEQYKQLKDDIFKKGIEEPIIMSEDGVILDGYTRYQIAKELGIKEIETIKRKFDTEEEEREYIIRKGLLRRHLNPAQRGKIAKHLEKLYREIAKKNRKSRKGKNEPHAPVDTRKQATEKAGCSATTLSQTKKIESSMKEMTPEQKKESEKIYNGALKGDISLTKATTKIVGIIKPEAQTTKTEPPKPPEDPKCVMCNKDGTRRYLILCLDCYEKLTTKPEPKDKKERMTNQEAANSILKMLEPKDEPKKPKNKKKPKKKFNV